MDEVGTDLTRPVRCSPDGRYLKLDSGIGLSERVKEEGGKHKQPKCGDTRPPTLVLILLTITACHRIYLPRL